MVAISVGYFSALATRELNNTFGTINTRTIPVIDAVNDLRYYAARALNHANELALIVSPSFSGVEPAYREHQAQQLRNAFSKFNSALAHYRSLVTGRQSDMDREILDMIMSTSTTLRQLLRELVELGRRGVSAEELFVKTEQIETYELTFLYAVDAALAAEVEQLDMNRDLLHEAITRTRNIAVVFGPVSVLVAVLITMYIARIITSALQRLKNASLAVASGNWNTRVARMPAGEFNDVIQTFNDMASALHARAESASSIRAYCHEILDTMAALMIVITIDGKIETVNSSAIKWLDVSEDALVGISIEEIFGKEYRKQVREEWLPKLIKGGNIPHARVAYVDRDKHEIMMIVSASSIRNRDGIVDGIVFKAVPESELESTPSS